MRAPVNPRIRDACQYCGGWGFFIASKHNDQEATCSECGGTGNRNKEGPPHD